MDSKFLKGKHIVLGICGGIAAYKSAALLRLLVKRGAEVQVIMTPAAKEFITPVTMSALSGKPVVSEFFTANSGEWHSHVDLGLWADLMVIAPATASTLAKMACGVADNMLVTTYLSAREHVIVAPAMDLDMFAHPSTRRNLDTLRSYGVQVIEPASGELASHLVGKGRMEEPERIVEIIEDYFRNVSLKSAPVQNRDFNGKKIAITAGPTYENIDPVRFIGNYSSGKMGFAIAAEFARRGAEVTLISGPVSLPTPEGVNRIDVRSACEMLKAAEGPMERCDYGIFAAAVADYRPANEAETKIKREGVSEMQINLVRNPDIAATCGARKKAGQLFVGFALETDKGLDAARAKLQRKNLDMVVLNTLADSGAGFGTDTNKVTIVTENSIIEFPLKSKQEVATDIIDSITQLNDA
ncbi:MAG: bifunctional phosphopantothenoylcysteine decarboxylase/phosphopantothenate--cysteine ligase CoaBC [Muribaculaceae bacterium]|nr:bifunctional phosphopantothenoylcysteine decarboxylase/phosphopantothenate--cysteine ligase CoaBC [Muribaculaceae bacterium]